MRATVLVDVSCRHDHDNASKEEPPRDMVSLIKNLSGFMQCHTIVNRMVLLNWWPLFDGRVNLGCDLHWFLLGATRCMRPCHESELVVLSAITTHQQLKAWCKFLLRSVLPRARAPLGDRGGGGKEDSSFSQ